MRVLVVGEGEHEKAALPTLVCRIAGEELECQFLYWKDSRMTFHGTGGGVFKRAVAWMQQAQRDGFDAVVLLIDLDRERYRERIIQMTNAQEHVTKVNLPRACGVAIRTFDAWMLADQQALSEVLGIDVQQQPEPEENRHPKQDCEILCARARDISLSQLYKGVCERVRIELLASRCPRGFATFAERVRGMAAAGN